IIIIEACFSNCWVTLLVAIILALKPYYKNDLVILNRFTAIFSIKEIENLSLENLYIDTKQLLELK
ncbi:hypothetical protein P154DRAFT_449156, partial [Amniculicola lignicola CBS 123094]